VPSQRLALEVPLKGGNYGYFMNRKIGVVVFGKPDFGWWFVRVGPPSSLEVYFLHQRFIRKGSRCELGSQVEFEPGEPFKPGLKPTAQNAEILDEAVLAEQILSGEKTSTEVA
jgi:hypothetical protein